jgi:hypothetical protein
MGKKADGFFSNGGNDLFRNIGVLTVPKQGSAKTPWAASSRPTKLFFRYKFSLDINPVDGARRPP